MAFRNRFFKKTTVLTEPKEWKAWQLSTLFTTSLFLIEVGVVVIIIVLERVSSRNNGLTTVTELPTDPVRDEPFSNVIWSYGLLWTTFPAFLMAMYRLGWDAIVNATAERQPYIDLRRGEENAHTVGRTVMLDYRHYPFFYNWLVAFKMKHFLIGCALFLSSVLSIALVPLTSHLFVAMVTVNVASFNATFPNAFNAAQLMNSDLQLPLGLARSTLVYKAESPPWSTTKFSFEPFELPQTEDPRNYTVPVHAYYGQLDCELLQVPTPEISFGAPQTILAYNTTQTTLSYKASDRGCNLPTLNVNLGQFNPTYYLYSWVARSCGDGAHISRVGILSGKPTSSTTMANVSITSCIPSYWRTTGSLTISTRKDFHPRFESFIENTSDESEFRPAGADAFEINSINNPQQDATHTFRADVLGLIVYEVAKQSNPDSPLDAMAIKTALGVVWPSVFTYLVTTSLIQDPIPRTVVGQHMKAENRLFVYPPVAWIVVAIMLSVAICNAFLIYTAERMPSILGEEPVGLLGAAALLHDSQVTSFVAENLGKVPHGLTFRETIQKKYTVSESKCWYDEGAKKIRLTGLQWRQTDSSPEEGRSGSGSSASASTPAPTAPENEPSGTPSVSNNEPSASSGAPDNSSSANPADDGIELQQLAAESSAEHRPAAASDNSAALPDRQPPPDSATPLPLPQQPPVQENFASSVQHAVETQPISLDSRPHAANIDPISSNTSPRVAETQPVAFDSGSPATGVQAFPLDSGPPQRVPGSTG